MKYLEIRFASISSEQIDLLVAELSVQGYESFWEMPEELRAYIPEEIFSEKVLNTIVAKYALPSYSIQSVDPQQWDLAQKDHQEFLVIEEQCLIRPPDFQAKRSYPYEILMEARLAFGSGQHDSTALCLAQQLAIEHQDKYVLDIGCGSAILSILAEQRGAKHVDAIDNNPWAIAVSQENLALNQCQKIHLQIADMSEAKLQSHYDLILANLNADVFRQEFSHYPAYLSGNGLILLSGFMEKDEAVIHTLAETSGLILQQRSQQNGWLALLYQRL